MTALLLLGLVALAAMRRCYMQRIDRRIRDHELALEARLGQRLAVALRRVEALDPEPRELPAGCRVELDELGQRWIRGRSS